MLAPSRWPCRRSPRSSARFPSPVTYWPIGIPTGQEVDFGSPDESGTAVQDTGWWPAVLFHDYEEKGVHPIHHRIYWKGWALAFYLVLGAPVWFFIGGTEVMAITEQTIDYPGRRVPGHPRVLILPGGQVAVASKVLMPSVVSSVGNSSSQLSSPNTRSQNSVDAN